MEGSHANSKLGLVLSVNLLRGCLGGSLGGMISLPLCAQPTASPVMVYTGMCDASAGVAVGPSFFAVANDEDNQIRIYRNDRAGGPVQSVDLSAFLEVDARYPETDLEGAAKIGDNIYWITSHGRNQTGKARASRQRFFATKCILSTGGAQIAPIGKPYKDLLRDLIAEPTFTRFNFAVAAQRPPKSPGAINIEGLSATPDNKLLIAFRNPIPNGKALLIPLQNPEEVVLGRQAKFGRPIQLDLGGLGVRDIALWGKEYLIIGGSFDGKGRSRLYRWKGGAEKPQHVHVSFKGFNPEGIVVYPDKAFNPIQIISDDGHRLINGIRCKDQKNPAAKSFRSFWVNP